MKETGREKEAERTASFMSRTITVRAELQTNLLRADSNADGAYFGRGPR